MLIGGVSALLIGVWQAMKGWARQQQSQRDHLLRTERIALCRRLVEAATTVVNASGAHALTGANHDSLVAALGP